jgi:His-Xaa-Ser system protein HxsD
MTKEKNSIVALVNLRLYSLPSIYAAAFVFLDEAYIRLEEGGGGKVQIILKGKKKLTEEKLRDLRDRLLNELLNCSLREQISKNNKKIREYVVARALASAVPEEVDQNNSVGNKREQFIKKPIPIEDPLGISLPWEKKGKK